MKDTWAGRDLPVLDRVVRLLDEGNFAVNVVQIAAETGFDTATVARALDALNGPFVAHYQKHMSGGVPDTWYVTEVTAAARQAVGQRPTPESLVDQLAEAFQNAAEQEPNAEKKGRLRQVANFLASTGRDVATEAVSKVILHSTGMG